jgi:thiamine kinase-like enzyme
VDDILAQLEPALGPPQGPVAPLQGGITNRNYRATLGGEEYVIRRHGRDTELLGIDRAAERIASGMAADLDIAPQVVAAFDGALVTRYVPCAPLDGGEAAARAAELAGALRRFHESGLQLPTRFWVPDLLAEYARIARERGAALPDGYEQTVTAAERIAAVVPLRSERPCHNDLLPGNLIHAQRDDRLLIVDWEYAAMGHPSFDLGNLSVNNGFDAAADERLLSAYDGSPPSDRRRAELALMRVLSDAREAAWGVVQGALSELDFDFGGYARTHFERLLATVEEPEFEAWLAAA